MKRRERVVRVLKRSIFGAYGQLCDIRNFGARSPKYGLFDEHMDDTWHP